MLDAVIMNMNVKSKVYLPLIRSLAIFNDTKKRPYKDESADSVENQNMASPWRRDAHWAHPCPSCDTCVKCSRYANKEDETNQLDKQSNDDDLFSGLDAARGVGVGEHAATPTLHQEREHVAGYKNLGELLGRDGTVGFAPGHGNGAPEHAIDGGGKKGGRDEQHKRLQCVRKDGPVGRLSGRQSTFGIANDLAEYANQKGYKVPGPPFQKNDEVRDCGASEKYNKDTGRSERGVIQVEF